MQAGKAALAILLLLGVDACSSSKQLQVKETMAALPADCQPKVFLPGEQLPAGYKSLAEISFGDTGFSVV